GVGVYDINGIENNSRLDRIKRSTEQILITPGKLDESCPEQTPPFGIREDYLNLDVGTRGDGANGDLYVYGIYAPQGVVDLRLHLPGSTAGTVSSDTSCDQRE